MALVESDETERSAHSDLGRPLTLQQRFERSSVGKMVISVLLLGVIVVCAVWNLPASPIRDALVPAVRPIAGVTGFDRAWAMYGEPNRRVETVEVHVRMATGENRVWTMEPGSPGVGWWDRWIMLSYAAVGDPSIRPTLARWVVGQVTKPDERPQSVSMILRTETLQAPSDEQPEGGRRPTAMKLLYQENLAGPQ
jgi:hypothetical protein